MWITIENEEYYAPEPRECHADDNVVKEGEALQVPDAVMIAWKAHEQQRAVWSSMWANLRNDNEVYRENRLRNDQEILALEHIEAGVGVTCTDEKCPYHCK